MSEEPRSFEWFSKDVLRQLQGTARDKGYNETLYELVLSAVPNSGHAVGEIIYKAVRYARRGDPQDLLKVAAWAYLAWRYHEKVEKPADIALQKLSELQKAVRVAAFEESPRDPRRQELPFEP